MNLSCHFNFVLYDGCSVSLVKLKVHFEACSKSPQLFKEYLYSTSYIFSQFMTSKLTIMMIHSKKKSSITTMQLYQNCVHYMIQNQLKQMYFCKKMYNILNKYTLNIPLKNCDNNIDAANIMNYSILYSIAVKRFVWHICFIPFSEYDFSLKYLLSEQWPNK